jgi:hypothetical protein
MCACTDQPTNQPTSATSADATDAIFCSSRTNQRQPQVTRCRSPVSDLRRAKRVTTTREARARGLSHFAGLLESLSDEDDSFFFLDFFVSFFSFFLCPSLFPFPFPFLFCLCSPPWVWAWAPPPPASPALPETPCRAWRWVLLALP